MTQYPDYEAIDRMDKMCILLCLLNCAATTNASCYTDWHEINGQKATATAAGEGQQFHGGVDAVSLPERRLTVPLALSCSREFAILNEVF